MLIISVFMGEVCGCGLPGYKAQSLRGCNQDFGGAAFSPGGLNEEEPSFKLTQVIVRIHFLLVIGLKVLVLQAYSWSLPS